MNGKTLKVAQYNLEFGATDRFVNIFGCFKYKENGNLYLLYTDVDTKYPVIYYGSAHVKEKNLLSIQCREANEQEIIKEYIFKITNHEPLDNFEMISLENVDGIEIIGSTKMDIKMEVLLSLVDILLPKKEEPKEEVVVHKQKKKSNKGPLIVLLIILIMAFIFVSATVLLAPKNTVAKRIVCQKQYQHDTLEATIDEENTYNFNLNDSLDSIDTTMIYQFNEKNYQEFIMKGLYYKYLPDDDQNRGHKQDDVNYTFKIMMTEKVGTSYDKPTTYEEVFSYYKKQGYTCTEEVDE